MGCSSSRTDQSPLSPLKRVEPSKGLLTECGWAASRTKTYLGAQWRQLARRRGKEKANIAVGHSILVIAWHLLTTPHATFQDLGADYFTHQLDPATEQRRLIRRLKALGVRVTLEPAAP